MPMDSHTRAFLDAAPPDGPGFEDMTVPQIREAIASMRQVNGPGLPVAEVRELTVPGPAGPLVARLYHPDPDRTLPLLVFFFGGGFVAGDIDVVDTPLRQLAVLGEVAVLSVSYRLAPEDPYPAAVEDAIAAMRYAVVHAEDLGSRPDLVAVGGESSGGQLATAAALLLRGRVPAPLALVLIYPVLDADFTTASYRTYADGHMLTRNAMRRFWAEYLQLDADTLPESAPAEALPGRAPDLAGLPPTLIGTSDHDPLHSEALDLAGRLEAAGVPTRCVTWRGLTHASWYLDRVSTAAALANQRFARDAGHLLHAASLARSNKGD